MTTMEQKFNALAAVALAEDADSHESAKKALRSILRSSTKPVVEPTTHDEDIVHQYLTELGANPALIGYKYTVHGILQAASNPKILEDITGGFYPMVAVKFDTTASRVERAIRHLIEETWSNGDLDILNHFFGSSYKMTKGKPTNSHFIARSAIIIRSRMKQ